MPTGTEGAGRVSVATLGVVVLGWFTVILSTGAVAHGWSGVLVATGSYAVGWLVWRAVRGPLRDMRVNLGRAWGGLPPLRPRSGPCLRCGAAEDQWCAGGCPAVDPADYR